MFVGREEELAVLEGLYKRDAFQMAVVYGRRRVGKTALLEKLSQGKPTLFFTARVQSSKANLRDFSRKIAEFFGLPQGMPPFDTWAAALSFVASSFGKWWGTDPLAREETDIDAIAANKATGEIVLGECKWRNSFDETKVLSALERRATLVKGYGRPHFVLFSKRPVSEGTRKKAEARSDLRLVCADELFG